MNDNTMRNGFHGDGDGRNGRPRRRLDFEPDEEITLEDAAEWIGPRRGGRPTRVTTVRSWASKGLWGVKLRCYQCGGMKLTTINWLREFWAALATAQERMKQRAQAEAAAVRTPTRRRRDNERARRELEAKGC